MAQTSEDVSCTPHGLQSRSKPASWILLVCSVSWYFWSFKKFSLTFLVTFMMVPKISAAFSTTKISVVRFFALVLMRCREPWTSFGSRGHFASLSRFFLTNFFVYVFLRLMSFYPEYLLMAWWMKTMSSLTVFLLSYATSQLLHRISAQNVLVALNTLHGDVLTINNQEKLFMYLRLYFSWYNIFLAS